jgi:hypothetical protein
LARSRCFIEKATRLLRHVEEIEDAQCNVSDIGTVGGDSRHGGGQLAGGGVRLSLLPPGQGYRRPRRVLVQQLWTVHGVGVRTGTLLQCQSARRLWTAAADAGLSGLLTEAGEFFGMAGLTRESYLRGMIRPFASLLPTIPATTPDFVM